MGFVHFSLFEHSEIRMRAKKRREGEGERIEKKRSFPLPSLLLFFHFRPSIGAVKKQKTHKPEQKCLLCRLIWS